MPNITGATSFFSRTAENSTPMTLTSSISAGATTVPVTGLLTNYNAGDIVVFTIDPSSATLKQVFTGTVSAASTVTGVIWTEGTNQPHTLGATIIDYTSATHWDLLQKGITVSLNQDGTIKPSAITPTTIGAGTITNTMLASGIITPDKVAPAATTITAATITPVTTNRMYTVTALASAATIATPSGTPTDGQGLVLRVKDNGTAQALTWGSGYRPIGVTLPSSTVATKNMYVSLAYNLPDTKWDVLSIGRET